MILFKAQAASPQSCRITDKDFVTDDVNTKYSTVQKKKSHLPHWACPPGKVFCTHQLHWKRAKLTHLSKRQQV